jgi:hypothetical protein
MFEQLLRRLHLRHKTLPHLFCISLIPCFLQKFEKRNGGGLAGTTTTTRTHKLYYGLAATFDEPPSVV